MGRLNCGDSRRNLYPSASLESWWWPSVFVTMLGAGGLRLNVGDRMRCTHAASSMEQHVEVLERLLRTVNPVEVMIGAMKDVQVRKWRSLG